MTVFFTADTHFGHGGARGLFRRPFASTAAMDAALLAAWNEVVAPGDEVWHLGDVAVGARIARVAELLGGLHGIKRLVRGNADGDAIVALDAWASVHDLVRLELDGRRVTLCHYPLRVWADQHRGAIQLHGHSHGRLAPLPRQFDVGVDARDFRPVRLDELSRSRIAAAPRRTPPGA